MDDKAALYEHVDHSRGASHISCMHTLNTCTPQSHRIEPPTQRQPCESQHTLPQAAARGTTHPYAYPTGAAVAITERTAAQTYPATFPPTAPDSRQALSLTACALPSHIPAHPVAPTSRPVRGSPCRHHATALAPTAPYDQHVPQLPLSLKRTA